LKATLKAVPVPTLQVSATVETLEEYEAGQVVKIVVKLGGS